jgi:hypothetical protein
MKSSIMKKQITTRKRFSVFILTLIGISYCRLCFGQFEIQYPKWYSEIKLKHLYIISGDSSTAYAKSIIDIVKANWKLTPVSVLSGSIPESIMVKGNGFLSVTSYNKSMSKNNTEIYSNDYYHLDIWTVKDMYDHSKQWEDYAFIIASAELYNRTIGMGKIANEAHEDFTSDLFANDYLNGMSGNIKNMIQYFNTTISANKTISLLHDHTSSPELKKLKTDTLFMPNYWYGKLNTMLGDTKENTSDYIRTVKYLDNVVSSYPYKIKFVTREELNDRIMNASKDLYYFNIIQSSADKIVSVVNGLTGEVVYSEVQRKSYRIKSSDLEKIGSAITN